MIYELGISDTPKVSALSLLFLCHSCDIINLVRLLQEDYIVGASIGKGAFGDCYVVRVNGKKTPSLVLKK